MELATVSGTEEIANFLSSGEADQLLTFADAGGSVLVESSSREHNISVRKTTEGESVHTPQPNADAVSVCVHTCESRCQERHWIPHEALDSSKHASVLEWTDGSTPWRSSVLSKNKNKTSVLPEGSRFTRELQGVTQLHVLSASM